MATDPTTLTVAQLQEQMAQRKLCAEHVTAAYLDRIEQLDDGIHAYLRVNAETALAAARAIDQRRRAGETLGPLAGIPVSIKDNLCDRTTPTTCASRMLESFQPPYDAAVIERLKAADAILIGRTNLDEFAMGGSTEHSAFGPTRNPWDRRRVPGGSSGGAAAAVAADLAPLAVGSDTGGSIRQPAAYCGVSGLKPTYGRVSRYGLVAFASSLDQVGPIARSAADLAALLQVIAGHDPRDSTSVRRPVPDLVRELQDGEPLPPLRVGWLRAQCEEGVEADVAAALDEARQVLESLGAQIVDIDLPHLSYGVATYYLIAPSEASSNLARYDGVHYGLRVEGAPEADESALIAMYRATRSAGFGNEVKRRVMLGTYALSAGYYDAFYLKALRVRRLIRDDYLRAFEQVDLLAGPTTPTAAFAIGELTDDPLALYLQDLFTVTANLAGVPALSIPCGRTAEGLPVGLQLQGPHFAEDRLLLLAHHFQQATTWHQQRPPSP